ncbi:MAG: hypothetical protein E6Q59_06060 [Nitrosomonas sp.]|nr:MAG: hypothetical protein E6Q59_06060 [Nitrosomonas sp.]
MSVLFSFIALVLPGLNADGSVTATDILNLLGVTITGISFMIASYFALKAIDAYNQLKYAHSQLEKLAKHLQEISNYKEKLKDEVTTLSKTKGEIFLSIGEAIETILVDITDTLHAAAESEALSKKSADDILRLTNITLRHQGRLSFIKHLPERIKYLKLLSEYGKKDDEEDLEKLFQDPTESEEIKSQAKHTYAKILGEYGNENDLKKLEKLFRDPTESQEIKSQAKKAYVKITERLAEKKENQNPPT